MSVDLTHLHLSSCLYARLQLRSWQVMAAMQECMSDPSKIMQYQSDPDIQKVIMKLMGMGLGGMGGMGGMGGGMGAQQAPSFDEESTASQPPRPTSVEEVD